MKNGSKRKVMWQALSDRGSMNKPFSGTCIKDIQIPKSEGFPGLGNISYQHVFN